MPHSIRHSWPLLAPARFRGERRSVYSTRLSGLMPHDPTPARGLRRRLAAAPFIVLAFLAGLIALWFPAEAALVITGIVAFNLFPLFLHGFLSWRRFQRPVPGFRSIRRAAVKGAFLGFMAPLPAGWLAGIVLITLRFGFVDEASLGESPLSVTALGLPVGFLLWFMPQFGSPTAIAAAILMAGLYALAAVDYRRRLRRSLEEALASRPC